jgi:predicted nucleic acid-binding protein
VNLVFLDTVGLLALWDESDQWHDAASAAMAKLTTSGAISLTTTYVLLECGNSAARRPYRSAVERLRVALEAAHALIQPSADDWELAWEAYNRGDGAGAGIVDQFSFVVMRRLGIAQTFTNDKHFEAAGFESLF